MASFNKVILMGNLTRDPELRYTPQGAAVCEFGLAMNEKYRSKAGEDVEKVCFVDITCWNKTAEIAAQYLKKGTAIHIEGKLTQDRWEDAGGQKRSKHKVTCERLTFVGSKDSNGAGAAGGGGGQRADANVGQDQTPEGDDIPF